MLRVKLLGKPQIQLNHHHLTELLKLQGTALCAYLIMADKPQKRATLAQIFWPTLPLWRAKINLRHQVRRLQWLMGDYVVSTCTQVAFNHNLAYWLDAKVFTDLVNAIHVRSASTTETGLSTESNPTPLTIGDNVLHQLFDLYRAEFMSGFEVGDAPHYTQWIVSQRNTLETLRESLACQRPHLKIPLRQTEQTALYIPPQIEARYRPIRQTILGC